MPFLDQKQKQIMDNKFQRYYMISKDLIHYYLPDYKVEFCTDHDRTAVAKCWYIYHKITINIHYVYRINISDSDFINTILHEIAHGLVPDGLHSNAWRNKFIEIGGDGEVYYHEPRV